MKIKDILEVSENRRHQIRSFQKRRSYNCERRRKFSREELLDYLKVNNFTSLCKLYKGRHPGEPNEYDYRKEFGCWVNARSAAFGMKEINFGFDEAYLLKAIIEFNLWRAKDYRLARKKDPFVFPSFYRVLKKWGGKYSIAVGVAKQLSFKATLNEYRRLWRKLGRIPSMAEVVAEGIILDSAIDYYKTKGELDKTLASWEGNNEG